MKKPAIHSILPPTWFRKQDHLCVFTAAWQIEIAVGASISSNATDAQTLSGSFGLEVRRSQGVVSPAAKLGSDKPQTSQQNANINFFFMVWCLNNMICDFITTIGGFELEFLPVSGGQAGKNGNCPQLSVFPI
jgi:hypothetical protein